MGCKVGRFFELVHKLSELQRGWVREMGFKYLLRIKIRTIDPRFGYWITNRFNPRTMELKIREGVKVVIDTDMVGWVLGIPSDDDLLPVEEGKKHKGEGRKWIADYKDNKYGGIAEKKVFRKTCAEKTDGCSFKRHFLLYVVGALLCPTEKRWISLLHLNILTRAKRAGKYNWGGYLLNWLVKYCCKRRSNEGGFGGCTLFLILVYLDRLNLGQGVNWDLNRCRLVAWNQEMVDRAIQSDMGPDGRYGAAQIVENVIYGMPYPIPDPEY